MDYRTVISKLDQELWYIPESFLSEHGEFLQAIVDRVKEELSNKPQQEKEFDLQEHKTRALNEKQELDRLLAFRKWQKDNWKDVYLMSNEFMIKEFIKSEGVNPS